MRYLIDHIIVDCARHEEFVFPVLWRDSIESKTTPCPWCNRRHKHDGPDGHYHRQCTSSQVKRLVVYGKRGEWLHCNWGYLVKTRRRKLTT